jgi:hypothetical protein
MEEIFAAGKGTGPPSQGYGGQEDRQGHENRGYEKPKKCESQAKVFGKRRWFCRQRGAFLRDWICKLPALYELEKESFEIIEKKGRNFAAKERQRTQRKERLAKAAQNMTIPFTGDAYLDPYPYFVPRACVVTCGVAFIRPGITLQTEYPLKASS